MRILLPPSEGKRADPPRARRSPLVLGDDPLGQARRRIRDAVVELCGGGPDAAAALGLPASSADGDLAANRALPCAPMMPALQRFTGVVYAGLDAATLSPPARRRAATAVLIFSGLLGVVRGRDPVPLHRVPAAAVLPGVGGVAAFWRPVLTAVLPQLLGTGIVVDLRSADYAAMWRPDRRTVVMRILNRRPDGSLAVVSYDSKLAKGQLARELLERPARTVDDVVAAWQRIGGADAGVEPGGRGTPGRVDLIR